MYWTFIILTGVFTLLFVRNVLNWAFAMDNYFIHKKRLKQLKFGNKKSLELCELIDTIGKPARQHVLPLQASFDEKEIEKRLYFSGWDKYFTPKSYAGLSITLKIAAVLFLIGAVLTDNIFVGVLWGIVLFFGLDFFLDNAVTAKKEQIFAYFPEFLRITQGFLSSGMPLLTAIEKTLVYVNEEWQFLLKNFIVDFKTANMDVALDNLKTATDMFEVKEFVALIKLIIEQGGDMQEGFNAQVEAITEMQQFILEKKIAKRKTLAIVIQAPLLLAIFITFGLPIVGDMSSIGLL